ncbi:hypothetical protein [Methanobacterium sp.]|jgi:hypothetical protein|uniref:hypothetical protein n=1 Tax=Methanobacterium sp. TaxID=2164 RepID=UPI00315888CD
MNNSSNELHIKKIQESFLNVTKNSEDPICLLFVRCIINEEEGNLNEIGKSFQKISDFLINRLADLEFNLTENEDHGRKVRLEEILQSINEIGKELEQMTDEEQCSYQWSIIGILLMVVMNLFNHMEVYMDEK